MLLHIVTQRTIIRKTIITITYHNITMSSSNVNIEPNAQIAEYQEELHNEKPITYAFASGDEIKKIRNKRLNDIEEAKNKDKAEINEWFESIKVKLVDTIGKKIQDNLIDCINKNVFEFDIINFVIGNYDHYDPPNDDNYKKYNEIFPQTFYKDMSICLGNILAKSLEDAGGYYKVEFNQFKNDDNYDKYILNIQLEE